MILFANIMIGQTNPTENTSYDVELRHIGRHFASPILHFSIFTELQKTAKFYQEVIRSKGKTVR